MACGCSKKGQRNTMSPRGIARGVSGPQSSQGGLAAVLSPSAIRAQQAAATPQQERSVSGMNAERRKVEQIRRTEIRKKAIQRSFHR